MLIISWEKDRLWMYQRTIGRDNGDCGGAGVKTKLRIASLIMLIIAIAWVVFAFMTMDVPIAYPAWMSS